MKNKESEKVAKAYEKIKEKHPDICNENKIEMLTRKYLMRNNLLKSVGLFIVGNLLVCPVEILCAKGIIEDNLFISFIMFVGAIMVIVGVCTFAKSMHDPLTPKEAQELAEKDKKEKG